MKPIRYVWNEFIYKIKYRWNPVKWVPATILCIRFPFLYPRNRFSDKHYTNWKLRDKMKEAWERGYEYVGEPGSLENPYRQVVKDWRWVFLGKFYDVLENILGIFHFIPYYTELISMPEGWKRAFGIQMCKEIKRALLEEGGRKKLRGYRINDIKEKWGSLAWYSRNGCEEVTKIIEKYGYISYRTCINCGRSADYITSGWITPYCKKCIPQEKIESADKYFSDIDFYGWTNGEYYKKHKNDKKGKKQ